MPYATQNDWNAARDQAVWSRHGIASLALTQWLDDEFRTAPGLPGRWRTDGTSAIGDLDGRDIRLAVGEEAASGDLLLRGMRRGDAVAVRVLDPAASARRGVSSIVRAPHDPEARVTGHFEAAAHSATSTAVDGHHDVAEFVGVVSFRFGDVDLSLDVQSTERGLFAAFSDATSGTDSYRFRFLQLDAPAEDGTVTVDLNRAFLPPCAFSDHYLCVFPPAGNRWNTPVRVGELLAV
ncbi:DUF1684 domain-containing protein [Microbacterium koreense]|uniref:DUF1684 domain-containing protein n=1 Tax=Microbacterium koreense TaxID=323761 RepID=A0ABW2ZU85_9MICO